MTRERGREKMRNSAVLPLAVVFLAGVALLASPTKGIEVERRSTAVPPQALPPIAIEPPPPPQYPLSIVVEGVIYCRCKLPGYERAVDGAPVRGAVVLLRCSSGRNAQVTVKGRTDKHGYFYLQAPLKSKYSARRCRVFVLSSPVRACRVPRQYGLRGGGASVVFERRLGHRLLYNAGFLELGPAKSTKCYL